MQKHAGCTTKLGGDIKCTLMYELIRIKQVYLNSKHAAFLYTDFEISTFLLLCSIWTKFG